MAKADGSVIIATIIDTEGVEKGTVELKKDLLDLGDSASKANKAVGVDLVSGFKKLGAAVAASKVVEKLYEFGQEAIELGSDLEEVQNVVDVTFKTMSDKVNKFAKDAQKSAGLSEKMAKQYVGTFGAMADSFGFTEVEAYEMSTALTQLTGDVASFYNLSQDEAMNKLKGVFTGETEALKELGVVMTQAALDNYALANGYEKTTSAMTEQEKVALRYQFVMDQLSASSGDFVRTQDSWANQSKVLALQWESLMATIGTGLIDVLSPGMEFLNDEVLPALGKFAERFAEAMEPTPSEELAKSLKKTEKAVKEANEQFKESAEQVEINAISAEHYKNRLEELEKAGVDSAEAQIAYKSVVEQLNELYPELNLKISEQTGLLDDNSRAALGNLEAQKQKYLMMAVEAEMTAIYQAQGEAQAALSKAMYDREQVTNSLKTAEEQLAATSKMSIDELISLYDATDGGSRAIQNMDGSVVALTGDQIELIKEIKSSRNELDNLNGKIEKGQKNVDRYNAKIIETGKAYGIATEEQKQFKEGQEEVSAAVSKTESTLQDLQTEYANAKESARASIDSQIGLFDELKVKSDKSAADIVKNWESQRVAFDNYSANLQKAVDMGLDEALVKQLSDGSTESMAVLNEFVTNTDLSVDDINEAFRKTEKSKETVSTVMAEVQTDMAGKLDEIEEDIRKSWDGASIDVKKAIQEMQAAINSLRGKSVTLEIKTRNTGSTGRDMSLSNPSLGGYSLRSPEVPYLASGAVIPPNAPFMAVLGDQRRGTNIEAPLATIQEAVRNELGGVTAGNAAMVDILSQILETVAGIEIGDTVIGQAVERYNRHTGIMNGGAL